MNKIDKAIQRYIETNKIKDTDQRIDDFKQALQWAEDNNEWKKGKRGINIFIQNNVHDNILSRIKKFVTITVPKATLDTMLVKYPEDVARKNGKIIEKDKQRQIHLNIKN